MTRILFFLSVGLSLSIQILAKDQFYINAAPAWVEVVKFDTNYHLYNNNKEDGGTYLLLDFQQSVSLQERFMHYAVKIEEEDGIQNYSDIWVNYDPSYQKLIFNKLVIYRDNQELDRLKESDFKIVQNETDLERKIFSGNYTAGINIEDVQAGDIIEYAYTIKGENPIFGGNYFDEFGLEFSVPVNKYFLRILFPKNRHINYKLIKSTQAPKQSLYDGQTSLTWELSNITEVVANSNTPPWYITYGEVQLSEFSTWKDVIRWGKLLYPQFNIKNSALEKKLIALTKGQNNLDDKINNIIRFVQDEIRYVGIEINENSHKPHSPLDVYSKRFGDCKDKSYLLVTLLQSIGVKAWPVYVNTNLQQAVSNFLPSPTVFNHVIVAVLIGDRLHYIDPTLTNQRGNYLQAYFGNYKKVLVLNDEYDSLLDMATNSIEKIVIQETIDVADSTRPSKYNVVSTYYGGEANQIRNIFRNQTAKEIESSYLNFYSYLYPSMKIVDEVKYQDNEKDNVVKVVENYEIDNFWSYDDSPSVKDYVSKINSTNLEYYITNPTQRNRTMPFSLYHPIEIENQIKYVYFKDISIDEKRGDINNACFNFSYNIKKQGNTVIFDYKYKSLKDFVSVKESEQYYKDIDRISDLIWYEFTYGKAGNEQENGSPNWLMVFLSLLFIIILILIAQKLYIRDVEVSHGKEPLPIGGWLVLPTIGIIVTPVIVLFSTFTAGFYNLSSWEFISSTESEGYNSLWAFTFVFELLVNCLFLVYSVFLIILLFKKRTIFPLYYVLFRAINLVFIIADTYLLSQINSEYMVSETTDMKEIARSVIGAVIWIPYMLTSQRVKDTFVVKHIKPSGLKKS